MQLHPFKRVYSWLTHHLIWLESDIQQYWGQAQKKQNAVGLKMKTCRGCHSTYPNQQTICPGYSPPWPIYPLSPGWLGTWRIKPLWGCVCHCHTSAGVLLALQNLLEIVWRIFKVSFQYFSIHLHSHSATQRFAETAAGSGGIIERPHETQPGFCKERIFSSSAPFLWIFWLLWRH